MKREVPRSFRQLAHQILSDPENANRLDVDILSEVMYEAKTVSMRVGITIGLVLGIIIGLML